MNNPSGIHKPFYIEGTSIRIVDRSADEPRRSKQCDAENAKITLATELVE